MGNSHSGPPPPRRRNAKDGAITYGSKGSKSGSPPQVPIKVQFPSAFSSRINLPNPHPLDRTLKQHKSEQSLHLPTYAYKPSQDQGYPDDLIEAYRSFLKVFPEYQLTWLIDTLRRSDFSRVHNSGETYVDYMGGSLYPESLIQCHTTFLSKSVMGNTHSVSNTSKLSSDCAAEAQEAVLSFFGAPKGYTVVWTANATAALKLVGESFPFKEGSTYVLGVDAHNSVHGIREFARRAGAKVCYINSPKTGGYDIASTRDILLANNPGADAASYPSLFAYTGQSNITNTKNPLSTLSYASSLGYYTLLDAAALAPTSIISLTTTPVDAMVVSFYKMFGFPTGVGALIIKESFLRVLQRPWFAGGNVDVVQVPGTIVTRSEVPYQQFEDGTINYLSLPSVTHGLRFLSVYLPFLPLRLSCLLHFLITSLVRLRHDSAYTPVVRVLSRAPTLRLKNVGEQSDTGSIVSMIFLDPSGTMLPNSFIEHAASSQNISLRTGCMCNPGGAAALLGREDDMLQLHEGVTHHDFEANRGELGVVRVSLGLATSFQDVWRVIRFAATLGSELHRQVLWDRWNGATTSSHGNWQGSKRHQAESWRSESGGSSSEHNNYGS